MTPDLAHADPAIVRDNFGAVGMIDMPSAHMAPDGELSLGASFFQNTQHYNLGFQILPWLEGSFRYSGLQKFDAAYPTYYDRSFAVKARLLQETAWLPDLSVGINDLIDTGIYGGEYLTASKQFGNLDATLGIGWGRLASASNFRNPLSVFSGSSNNRTSTTTGAGQFQTSEYFHGPAGIFGGLIWRTPITGLSLIGEYSSDAYTLETARGNFSPRNQFNFGAAYDVTDNLSLGLDWLYGRSVSANLSFHLDPVQPAYAQRIGAPALEPIIRSDQQRQMAIDTLSGVRIAAKAEARPANGINLLADALWRQPDIRDIGLDGRTLLLTVASDNPVQDCAAANSLNQLYGSNITAVSIRGSNGYAMKCSPMAPSLGIFQEAAFGNSTENQPVSMPVSRDMLTIDATNTPQTDHVAAIKAIIDNARAQGIRVEAVFFAAGEIIVYYSNSHYFAEIDALDRLTRILMADAPADIEKFRLVSIANGIPQSQFDVLRAPQERAFESDHKLDRDAIIAALSPAPLQDPFPHDAWQTTFPRFSWSIFPQLRQEVFDSSRPFAVQVVAGADATLTIAPGLSLYGEAETSLFDNFDKSRLSDSVLPHVRTDFLKYLNKGGTGIGALELDYRFRLAPDIFAIARTGYLESMFGGGGGEVLWRPDGQRWALGIDAYEVWKRNFDRLFGFQNYHVFTGHVSLYYTSPWYNLNFALRAGQYLAGDHGLTLEVTRRFETGVEIGAFVTKTNVSASQFGEGSFDKGIIIRIPLEWALPMNTQAVFSIDLRPVQRDGGQRLMGDTLLFDETRRASLAELQTIRP